METETIAVSGHKPSVIRKAKLIDPQNIQWVPFIFITAIHIAAISAFFNFTWPAFWTCIVLHWVTGGVGITLCYHRLLTHRSFQVPKPLEYVLAVIGALACQGGPVAWVSAHRLHHARSDQPEDPHSPRDGFFWSHMGWCLHNNSNLDTLENQARWAPDLARDKGMVFIDKTQIVWTILLAAGLFAIGGWPFVCWGIFMRLVLVYHSTWFVNSAAHIWGYKTYASQDDSTNLWWVALLTYGEGWHNNHHAFQSSARHGLKWWEFDTTYLMIQVLEKLGLAKAVKIPSSHLLNTKAKA